MQHLYCSFPYSSFCSMQIFLSSHQEFWSQGCVLEIKWNSRRSKPWNESERIIQPFSINRLEVSTVNSDVQPILLNQWLHAVLREQNTAASSGFSYWMLQRDVVRPALHLFSFYNLYVKQNFTERLLFEDPGLPVKNTFRLWFHFAAWVIVLIVVLLYKHQRCSMMNSKNCWVTNESACTLDDLAGLLFV